MDEFPLRVEFRVESRVLHILTAGAERALRRAAYLAAAMNASAVEPLHLLWAMVLDESRATAVLLEQGLNPEKLRGHWPLPEGYDPEVDDARDPAGDPVAQQSEALQAVVYNARREAVAAGLGEIGTEFLLWGLVSVDSSIQSLLHSHGLTPHLVGRRSLEQAGVALEPLPMEEAIDPPDATASDRADAWRILDAAANRVREGLRVLEDYARFALDDKFLTSQLKDWRHGFTAAVRRLDSASMLAFRDTVGDVGTVIHTRQERTRETLLDVATAAFKRVQEAARTLEECGKIIDGEFSERVEALRYQLYTLEKMVLQTALSHGRFEGRMLYLLLTEALCPAGSGPVVRAALAAGVGIIQVREKEMSDRRLLAHGQRVREWTAKAGALFIMNDRPDLAVLTGADGVHVGQDELPVREARRILGPNKLIGVSTHTIEQARQAVRDGADYIGVGPVFPSTTKSFEAFAGLEFVRQVAEEITLPAFPIGGINAQNIALVRTAGATRAAVSGAICGAADPAAATEELRRQLDAK